METVSIVCAVRNERKTIEKHLQSLVEQTYPKKEIIIIDDESTDGTSEVAQKYAKKYKFIHYTKIKHPQGGSHTDVRLIGMKKVTGNIVCIVDADACYTQEYLSVCAARLKDKKVGGAIGKMRMWDPSTFISKYRDAWYTYRFDNEELVKREIKRGGMGVWVFKKNVYHEVGGYNPKLRYGEDVDLALRIQKAGYDVVYEPRAIWYHKWEETVGKVMKKNMEIGKFDLHNRRGNIKMMVKIVYFLSILPLLFLSPFITNLWIIALIHPIPLIINAIVKFFLCRRSKNRAYMLMYPLISYMINICYGIGFIIMALKREL